MIFLCCNNLSVSISFQNNYHYNYILQNLQISFIFKSPYKLKPDLPIAVILFSPKNKLLNYSTHCFGLYFLKTIVEDIHVFITNSSVQVLFEFLTDIKTSIEVFPLSSPLNSKGFNLILILFVHLPVNNCFKV